MNSGTSTKPITSARPGPAKNPAAVIAAMITTVTSHSHHTCLNSPPPVPSKRPTRSP
jgi:hypothetical protein